MSLKGRLTFVVLWTVLVFVVGVLVSVQAQTRREPDPVISGADIGFRPEGWKGKARTGTFVVRINGEWVEAVDAVKTLRLKE
jgi:hypothetical protein